MKKASWEKEFDRKFPEHAAGLWARADRVKHFISQEITKAEKEMAEKLKMEFKDEYEVVSNNTLSAYNKAVSDFNKKIDNYLKNAREVKGIERRRVSEITYKDAQQAKEILLEYLNDRLSDHESKEYILKYKDEYIVWLALKQDYFLE